jgi:RimJ/RimL family protein N-acetyltransferase
VSFVPKLPILTERLTLRAFDINDLEPLRDIYTRPEVVRYLYTEVWSERLAKAQLASKIAGRQLLHEGDVLTLAVVPTETRQTIGEVLIKWRSQPNAIGELGYVFHPEGQGRGYAVEAGGAMLHLAFEAIGLQEVQARCDARNRASVAVMERLGMRYQPQLATRERVKGAWSDTLVYAIDLAAWRGRSATGPRPDAGSPRT